MSLSCENDSGKVIGHLYLFIWGKLMAEHQRVFIFVVRASCTLSHSVLAAISQHRLVGQGEGGAEPMWGRRLLACRCMRSKATALNNTSHRKDIFTTMFGFM